MVSRAASSIWLWAFAAYALLALLANLPGWPGDPARIAACACGGNKDAVQTAWFLAWTPFALLHGHNVFSTSWLNYPVGVNLAQNTGMALLGVLTAPLTLAVSPVASENLLRWLAFPLSAIAMYAVLRRWVGYAPAAFVGGLLYGFSPYMVGQASVHLDLSFVPLPPLILYALFEVVVRQEHSALTWGSIAGILAVAQFYISAEILATTALAAAITGFALALLRPRAVPVNALHALVGLSACAVVIGACTAYPLELMTRGPLHYSGPAMGTGELYNADLLGPVLPTSAQLVAPTHLVPSGSSLVGGLANVDENGSYLGIPLLLVLAYLGVRHRRHRWLPLSLAMAVVMFALSLGPRLEIDGRFQRLPFPMPFVAISHVPLLDDLLPARLALYVTLFVAVAVAIGIDACREDLRARSARAPLASRRGRARVAHVVVRGTGVIVLLAAVVALLPSWPYRSVAARPAPAEQRAALRVIPPGTVVLTYPYAAPSTDVSMLWQSLDAMAFKLVGGYALRRGPGGTATLLPTGLKPYDVIGMLADPLAPVAVPIPKVPYLAPTDETVHASRILIGSAQRAATRAPAVAGVVQNANPRTRSFFVVVGGQLVQVDATRRTHYLPATTSLSPFRSVRRGEHVAVFGAVTGGTVTARRVRDLQRFVHDHDVGAVLVQLGRTDSSEVVDWVRRALGPPARSSAGGDLWLVVARHRTRR